VDGSPRALLCAPGRPHRSSPPDAVIFSLLHEVIERLPRDGFVLSEIDLEMWLALDGRNPLG